MLKTKRFLSNIDQFGQEFSLNFNGKSVKSTWSTIIISIIYTIIAILIMLFNFNILFFDNAPNVFIETSSRSSDTVYTIVPGEMELIYTMINQTDLEPIKLNPDLAKKENSNINIETKVQTSQKDVMITENCKFGGAEGLHSNLFTGAEQKEIAENGICQRINKPVDIGPSLLVAQRESKLEGFMKFESCKLDSSLCSHPGEDASHLTDKRYLFSITYETLIPKMAIDAGYQRELLSFDDHISPLNDYEIIVKITKNTIASDKNFIFNFMQPEQIDILTISSITLRPVNKVNIQYIDFHIKYVQDTLEVTYNRSYLKFDDALANIQAVTDLLVIIASFLVGILNGGVVEKYIANKLYFEPNSKKRSSTNLNIIDFKKEEDRSDQESQRAVKIQISKPKVTNSQLDRLKLYFGCRLSNKRLRNAINLVEFDSDFINISKRLIFLESYVRNEIPEESRKRILEMRKRNLNLEEEKVEEDLKEANLLFDKDE